MPDPSSILETMHDHRAAIASGIHGEIFGSLPGYSQLPGCAQEKMFDELYACVGQVMAHAAAGEPIPEAELAIYRAQGFSRGSMGVPFDDLISAFHLSSVSVLRMFWQLAGPENYRDMFTLQAWLAREGPPVMDALVEGYMTACRQQGNEPPGRKLLIELLLEGKPAGDTAAALGVTLAPAYLVLMCQLPQAPLRQDLRQKVLAQFNAVPGTLTRWDLDGITALIPSPGDTCRAGSVADTLVSSARQLTGQPVRAAQAFRCTLTGVADAAAEAAQVLGLLSSVPDPASRAYRLDELLIEYAISKNTEVIKRLADQLAPLDAGTELSSTLEALYSCDLDRERTARHLHIHRRTLTYRLNRIRQLCGIDPGTAHGIALLRAALTARRMLAPAQ